MHEAIARLEIVAVDDNSEYMKNAYKRVGSDRAGQPTDPDAIAAGVSAEIDLWSETQTKAGIELRDRHADCYLIGRDRAALENYLATLAPVPNGRKLVLEHVTPLPDAKDHREYWRTYYVNRTKIIDETAIASASTVEPDEQTIHPSVSMKFTPAGKDAFAEATAKHVGHKLATIVDGDVVIAPVINNAIRGGVVTLSMPSTSAADQLLKRLGC